MCETEAIVNSRPLTATNLTSPNGSEPLTPNHLLTMKSRVLMPPPGEFLKEDIYLVKRWRRVQYLVNQFWLRWRKEFLCSLQQRQKWTTPDSFPVVIYSHTLRAHSWISPPARKFGLSLHPNKSAPHAKATGNESGTTPRRNMQVGDIVLLSDDNLPRNH